MATPGVVERLADVFAAMGRVTHIGPVGTGQMTKLANQIIVGATMVRRSPKRCILPPAGGADPAAVRKALMGGFADSKILNIHGERMVERNFVPGGPAEYQLKDLRTAQALAARLGLHFTLLDCLVGMFGDMIGSSAPVWTSPASCGKWSGAPASQGLMLQGIYHDRSRHAQRRRRHRADPARPSRQDECDHAGNDRWNCRRSAATSTPERDIRVVTIAGAGERAFSAGSDLNTLADLSDCLAFRDRIEYAALVARHQEAGHRRA